MENRTANRVIDLPYVGVVLLVYEDGVETVSTVAEVEFAEVQRKAMAEATQCRKHSRSSLSKI